MSRSVATGRVSSATRDFLPTQIPETKFWYSARNTASITNVSGAASAWASTGTVYTVSQATSGKRPTIAAGINGHESLLFTTASSQELTNTTDTPVASGIARYAVVVAKASSATGGAFLTFRLGTRFWSCMAELIAGDRYYFTDGVSVNGNESGTGPDFTQPSIIEYEMRVGSLVVRVNGVTRTVVGGVLIAETGTTGFSIGSRPAAGFYGGHIADIYLASDMPSPRNKQRLREYLAAQNGITL